MTAIQTLLILSIVLFTLIFFLKLKKNNLIKILLSLITAFGIYFVLFPKVTTTISNELGVGRGTDLLLYVIIIGVLFTLIAFYIQLRKLKAQITILIREKAINEAVILGKPNN